MWVYFDSLPCKIQPKIMIPTLFITVSTRRCFNVVDTKSTSTSRWNDVVCLLRSARISLFGKGRLLHKEASRCDRTHIWTIESSNFHDEITRLWQLRGFQILLVFLHCSIKVLRCLITFLAFVFTACFCFGCTAPPLSRDNLLFKKSY